MGSCVSVRSNQTIFVTSALTSSTSSSQPIAAAVDAAPRRVCLPQPASESAADSTCDVRSVDYDSGCVVAAVAIRRSDDVRNLQRSRTGSSSRRTTQMTTTTMRLFATAGRGGGDVIEADRSTTNDRRHHRISSSAATSAVADRKPKEMLTASAVLGCDRLTSPSRLQSNLDRNLVGREHTLPHAADHDVTVRSTINRYDDDLDSVLSFQSSSSSSSSLAESSIDHLDDVTWLRDNSVVCCALNRSPFDAVACQRRPKAAVVGRRTLPVTVFL